MLIGHGERGKRALRGHAWGDMATRAEGPGRTGRRTRRRAASSRKHLRRKAGSPSGAEECGAALSQILVELDLHADSTNETST